MDEASLNNVQKFTELVRTGIRDNKVDLVATKRDLEKYEHSDLKSDLPTNQQYGVVEKAIFQKILDKYETMQKDRDKKDSPVTGDDVNIMGNNLSNYLHSRPGFHNFGSTTVLMKLLKIKDPNRYSLLGGISSLEPPAEERLSTLKQIARRAELDGYVTQARQLLNLGRHTDAQNMIDRCARIDPANPEIQALNGALQLALGNLDGALSILSSVARRREVRDLPGVSKDLSQAHTRIASRHGNRQNWEDAIRHYGEAIRFDPTNELASHQLNYCQGMLNSRQWQGWGNTHRQNYQRRS